MKLETSIILISKQLPINNKKDKIFIELKFYVFVPLPAQDDQNLTLR